MTRKKNNFPQVNFYCDESCYIQKDEAGVMVLAAVFCSSIRVEKIKEDIKNIKMTYGFPNDFEIKWTKVGKKTIDMYKDILDYIANRNPYIKVRVLFTPSKDKLNFEKYWYMNYSDWFQRMYYQLLKQPIDNVIQDMAFTNYKLYVDKKDSNSEYNTQILCNVLSHSFVGCKFKYGVYDSKEIMMIQLADLFAGATSYKNRGLLTSAYKVELVEFIEKNFKVNLSVATKASRRDFNIFKWMPKDESYY